MMLSSFRKAQSLDKNNAEILVNLGTVYYYKKQFDSARSYLIVPWKVNDEEANAFNALAMVEVELKNYRKASELLSKALSIDPDDPYFLNNRGYLFFCLRIKWTRQRQISTLVLPSIHTTGGPTGIKEFII